MTRIIATLFALLLLAACSRTDEGAKKVQWVELDDVSTECKDGTWTTAGGYRWNGDTCYVFTGRVKSETDKGLHMALGHEVHHCFKGDFHARLSY